MRNGRTVVFAFGSNLSRNQMFARCPSAAPYSKARLRRFTLTFGGYSPRWGGGVATIATSRRHTVHGALYVLDEADLLRLDGYEGSGYERTVVEVLAGDRPLLAWTYRQVSAPPAYPSSAYIDRIRAGLRDWQIPTRTLDGALSRMAREGCVMDSDGIG